MTADANWVSPVRRRNTELVDAALGAAIDLRCAGASMPDDVWTYVTGLIDALDRWREMDSSRSPLTPTDPRRVAPLDNGRRSG